MPQLARCHNQLLQFGGMATSADVAQQTSTCATSTYGLVTLVIHLQEYVNKQENALLFNNLLTRLLCLSVWDTRQNALGRGLLLSFSPMLITIDFERGWACTWQCVM
jgi:hypothetical protein